MAPWTSPPSATFWGGGSLAKRHLSLRCNWCCPWGCLDAFLSLCMDIWSSWAGLPGDGAGKLWELQQNLGTQKRSQTLLERPKKWFIFAKPSQNDLQQNSGTNSEWLVGWFFEIAIGWFFQMAERYLPFLCDNWSKWWYQVPSETVREVYLTQSSGFHTLVNYCGTQKWRFGRMIFLFIWVIFTFHFNFPRCIPIFFEEMDSKLILAFCCFRRTNVTGFWHG